jgi:hypothetical protein
MFMQKILDFIYIVFFGKYTLDGFVSEKKEATKKYTYVFDSVFPNEEIMKIALSSPSSIILDGKNS